MSDRFEGIVALGLACVIIAYALVIYHQGQRIDKLEKQMCAWVIYEDGSASPRIDDFDRFKCMEGR